MLKDYLPEHAEIGAWSDQTQYSINKNKRWELQDKIDKIFNEDINNLKNEKFNLFALVDHNPHFDSTKMYYSNKDEIPIVKGKSNKSRAPDHQFNSELDVKLVIEEKKIWNVSRTPKKQKKALTSIEVEEGLDDDYDDEDHDTLQEDEIKCNRQECHTLEDFIAKTSERKNNQELRCEPVKKSYRGKIIFDPLANKNQNNSDSEDEEFEEISRYDPEGDTIIVFLTELGLATIPDHWINVSEAQSTRLSIYNPNTGILIITFTVSEDSTECRMKILSLQTGLENILDVFAECTTIKEICFLADQIFAGSSKKNNVDFGKYSVVSTDQAFLELFNKESSSSEVSEGDCSASDEHTAASCMICFSEEDLCYSGSCGDGYCSSCWSLYLGVQVKSKTRLILCPGYGCTIPVPISILGWFLPTTSLLDYISRVLAVLVETNISIYDCPNCKHIVKLKEFKLVNEVKCVCGVEWCLSCKGQCHFPSSCQESHDFINFKNKLDEHVSLETVVQVRKCPSCQTLWEKMWGCNYLHCTVCNTGFCWGCDKKHDDHTGICGKINQPLEKVEILPFPTENFSRQRIENFHLHLSLKRQKLSSKKYRIETMAHRFLAADRTWYFENMEKHRQEILEKTDRGLLIMDILTRAVNICTEGRQFLLNSALRQENATASGRIRISQKYMHLIEIDEALTNPTLGKRWKEQIKRLATLIHVLERSMKLSK